MRIALYHRVLKIVYQDVLQYRANLVMSWIVNLYTLLVPFAFWSSAYRTREVIGSYAFPQMMTYIVAVTLFGRVLVANGIQDEIAQEIREGRLSTYLIRPMDYRLYLFMKRFGRRGLEFLSLFLPFMAVAGVLAILGIFQVSPFFPNIVFFIVSGFLAIGLSYLIYFLFGMIAFWMLECSALYVTLGTVLYFLAGGLFPLDLFPGFRDLLRLLPFPYQLFFPLKVYLGGLTMEQIGFGLGIQFFWCVVMWGVVHIVWRRGLQRYTAFGG